MKLLEKINIDEQYSQFSESDDKIQTDNYLYGTDKFNSGSYHEEEIIIDKRRTKEEIIIEFRKWVILSTKTSVETSADGTVWEVIDICSKSGRTSAHNTFN